MRTVLAMFAVLLIPTGCDRPGAAPPAPAVPPPPAVTALPADATGLDFVDSAGVPAANLSCGSGGLRIVVPAFQPIASEDRLSIGMDADAFALVADLAAPGAGVTAFGDPPPELLDRLSRGEALFAVYGQQSVGPLAASSAAGLQTLVSACRPSN